jgi:hypothetical protein
VEIIFKNIGRMLREDMFQEVDDLLLTKLGAKQVLFIYFEIGNTVGVDLKYQEEKVNKVGTLMKIPNL